MEICRSFFSCYENIRLLFHNKFVFLKEFPSLYRPTTRIAKPEREEPKIGALISFSKRVALNRNTFWTIPIAKAEGILEQPFSVGLNFQL